jgi:hypothetical protein
MNQTSATTEIDRDARSRVPLPPATLGGLVVAVLAVLLIALITYRSLESREGAVERVTHTLAVQQQLEALLSSVKNAGTVDLGCLIDRVAQEHQAAYPARRIELRSTGDVSGDWDMESCSLPLAVHHSTTICSGDGIVVAPLPP